MTVIHLFLSSFSFIIFVFHKELQSKDKTLSAQQAALRWTLVSCSVKAVALQALQERGGIDLEAQGDVHPLEGKVGFE